MKNFLAWIRTNWLITTFIGIVVVVLPGSYFGSTMWATSLRQKQEKTAGDRLAKVKAARVDYTLPSFDPKQPAVAHKAEPNPALTKWFSERQAELKADAESVVRRAVDFNRGVGEDAKRVGRLEHKPLVAGLFPGAAKAAEEAKKKEMGDEAWNAMPPEQRTRQVEMLQLDMEKPAMDAFEDAILGKHAPSPYQSMLSSIGAGEAIDPVRLSETISDARTREIEKITANKRELTADETASLTKLLSERRLGELQSHARELSVYAGMDIFPRNPASGSAIPYGRIDVDKLNVTNFFLYQWDMWVYDDLLSAVRLANTNASGARETVENSVVKRIESITLADPDGMFESKDPMSRGGDATPKADPTAATPGMVPLDPELSITGRGMGSWNKVYDVRRATMRVVVSSARLNDFLRAIAQTNFMSVTDLDLATVDEWEDLRAGYYYGPEHVVRATVQIESVWLRDWTAAFMPPSIRSVLGVPEEAPAAK